MVSRNPEACAPFGSDVVYEPSLIKLGLLTWLNSSFFLFLLDERICFLIVNAWLSDTFSWPSQQKCSSFSMHYHEHPCFQSEVNFFYCNAWFFRKWCPTRGTEEISRGRQDAILNTFILETFRGCKFFYVCVELILKKVGNRCFDLIRCIHKRSEHVLDLFFRFCLMWFSL
jgi:hypothetical protein